LRLLLKLTKLLLDFLNGLLKLGRVVLHLLRAVEGLFHLLDGRWIFSMTACPGSEGNCISH
jgi:hypothetical protein